MIPVYVKPVMKSPNRLPIGTNPRGKPKGSNGATRKIPEKIHKRKKVKFTKKQTRLLKKESGNKLKIKEVKLFPIWKLIPARFEVIQYTVERAYVGKKLITQATNPEMPKRGIFDNKTISWIISLRSEFAGSYEKIAEHIEDMTGEKFSAQAIKDAIKRTGEDLEPEYNELKSELRKSSYVGTDPTGWRISGINFVLWMFCSTNVVLVNIEKSKARKMIVKILGNSFEGIVGSDCAPEFQKFAEGFQKCWGHLLRTTYTLAELNPKKDIVKLHRWLDNLFNEIKNFLEADPPPEKREKMFNYFDGKLEDIIRYKWKSKEAKTIVENRLVKFREDWLKVILFPEVPLTNNETESWIKTCMPTRKILYCHRTREGAKGYAIIQSLRLTLKKRRESPFHAIAKKLSEINSEFVIV